MHRTINHILYKTAKYLSRKLRKSQTESKKVFVENIRKVFVMSLISLLNFTETLYFISSPIKVIPNE